MSQSYIQHEADFFAQLKWILTYKYRKLLIALLLLLIIAISAMLFLKYQAMQKKLATLQAFEPVFILKLNRDLNVGDALKPGDLALAQVFHQELEETKDQSFICSMAALDACPNLYGRVLKVPVYKGSILRQEFLAQEGIEPGIVNLLKESESFVDLAVSQTGFNVFLKPDDLVDIYQVDRDKAKLLTKKAKIIMVDAQPLGKAPMQVQVDSSLKRNLTLAVQDKDLYDLTQAIKHKKIYVTLHNAKTPETVEKPKPKFIAKKKSKNLFQALTMIQGDEKEMVKQ